MSENLFSTKRETVLTGDQMLENAIRIKNERRMNLSALTEASRLSENNEDFISTMESTNIESEAEVKKSAALEQAQYMQTTRNLAIQQLTMRNKLIQEGMDIVTNNVIGQIIYESYWLDDPVKVAQVEQISESIANAMEYLEDRCMESKVPEAKQNRYLLNVTEAIRDIVTEASDRIFEECKKTNSLFAEFELNENEEDKLDEKLSDLGTDEIVDLIKGKVAQVIQDEKEKEKEKSEMFDDIEKETSDEEPETEDATNESTMPTEVTLEAALSFDKTDSRYTSNERHIASILENGATISIIEDPSWREFKDCISLLSKKIRNTIIASNEGEGACCGIKLIDELLNYLSSVPEDVPVDVKEHIMTMTNIIYGAVPVDEVIISRLGGTMGSPDLASNNPIINLTTVSWIDIFVNIKTNLSSVKEYLKSKCCKDVVVESASVTENTLERLISIKNERDFNRGIGGTLFESLMLGNLSQTERIVTEGIAPVTSEDIEDAALIESLLQYTVLETLNTIGLYNFRISDIQGIRQDYMKGISEGTTPIYGNSDSATMSNGKDKTGKKKIRINTRKMKNGCK